MKVTKDFSREAIQLVATKKPPIAFEVEQSVNQKMGESRTYKFFMQPEEDNLPMYSLTIEVFELISSKKWLIVNHQVKHALKGQDIGDMDATYTL
eukprot:7412239-Ditylum_brightwellii.AAC.1